MINPKLRALSEKIEILGGVEHVKQAAAEALIKLNAAAETAAALVDSAAREATQAVHAAAETAATRVYEASIVASQTVLNAAAAVAEQGPNASQ